MVSRIYFDFQVVHVVTLIQGQDANRKVGSAQGGEVLIYLIPHSEVRIFSSGLVSIHILKSKLQYM